MFESFFYCDTFLGVERQGACQKVDGQRRGVRKELGEGALLSEGQRPKIVSTSAAVDLEVHAMSLVGMDFFLKRSSLTA